MQKSYNQINIFYSIHSNCHNLQTKPLSKFHIFNKQVQVKAVHSGKLWRLIWPCGKCGCSEQLMSYWLLLLFTAKRSVYRTFFYLWIKFPLWDCYFKIIIWYSDYSSNPHQLCVGGKQVCVCVSQYPGQTGLAPSVCWWNTWTHAVCFVCEHMICCLYSKKKKKT